ncbi:MAG TPA: HEAT repeat domain-containing protein [Fimbriiglobus sp.]|nr:HEAT repeat domain-containing protein [Fimbriiglobus sp.]
MYRTAAILTAALTLTASAPAGDGILGLGLFKKRSKSPEPATQAKQLVATLQGDPDEKKRRQAAEQLRGLDPRKDGDIVPALIGTLQRDPSPAVRAEAAESIGKLRPIYQPAGIAMESALASDPDPKVRDAVKAALWQYHLNGYRTAPAGNPYATQTAEPPLAVRRLQPPLARAPQQRPAPRPAADAGFRPITNTVGKPVFYQPTPEPPLARPRGASRPRDEAKGPAVLPAPKPAAAVPDPAEKPSTPTVPTVSVPPLPTPPPGAPNG